MENKHQVLDALNEALRLEYSMIIHYPLISKSIYDDDIREMVKILGTVSIKHADTLANAITVMGGKPAWEFDEAPTDMDLNKIFLKQLDKEHLAFRLHSDSASKMTDRDLRTKFQAIANDEQDHIRLVENILALIGQGKG